MTECVIVRTPVSLAGRRARSILCVQAEVDAPSGALAAKPLRTRKRPDLRPALGRVSAATATERKPRSAPVGNEQTAKFFN